MQPADRGIVRVLPTGSPPVGLRDHRPSVEALMLNLGRLGIRVVALTAPTPETNVRPLSRALCASYAAAGVKSVLIDLEQAAPYPDADPGWHPGTRLNPSLTFQDPDGYDQVAVWPTAETRPLFNNLQNLRSALTEDLSNYKAVVLNLTAVLSQSPGAPNPLAVGRAADAVVLACGVGRTATGDAVKAVADLNGAGCKVIGTVVDNSQAVYPGRELARSIERFRYTPAWVTTNVLPLLRQSEILNP